jgi:hypothetical protein
MEGARFALEIEELRGALDLERPVPSEPNIFARRYFIEAKAGEEKVFALRLPPGSYYFRQLSHTDLSRGGVAALGTAFSVAGNETAYVGRLVIELPARMTLLDRFVIRVENAQQETVNALRATEGIAAEEVVKKIMRIPQNNTRRFWMREGLKPPAPVR